MSNVVNISLAKEIEALKAPVQPGAPPPYAATELVRELLLYHISSVGHESHVNLSGQVLSRSRKVYDAINQLMDKVNNLDTLEWSLFDKYTQAIPLLEKYDLHRIFIQTKLSLFAESFLLLSFKTLANYESLFPMKTTSQKESASSSVGFQTGRCSSKR
jgi:hypothetical protein